MSNAVFPVLAGLSWGVRKTPVFSTRVQTALSGYETRAALYSYPLYNFSLQYEFLREATGELQQLLGFFIARRGQFDSFLYTDPSDNSVTNYLLGVGNGTKREFQLLRSYGGFVEPVMNVNTVTQVTVNGIATTAYAVGTDGLLTLNTAPAAGQVVRWTGTYYFRCRFMSDEADFEQFAYQFWSLQSLGFKGCLGNKI
jgi:uncharacterized protein (TIGR02217 family)